MITRDEINTEWKAAYEKALKTCPPEFLGAFTETLFAAQRAMSETSVVATAEAFQAASAIVDAKMRI